MPVFRQLFCEYICGYIDRKIIKIYSTQEVRDDDD